MRTFLTIIFIIISICTYASDKSFYSDKNRGWYAYEAIPDNDTLESDMQYLPEKPHIPWDKVDKMDPAKFSILLEQTKNYALSFRTLENYENYAMMKNIAISRAEEFASLSTLWAQMNPDLTGESSYPLNVFGNRTWKEMRSMSIAETLKAEKHNYGLLYFYGANCPYCTKQAPVIKYFIDEFDWTVESLDIRQYEVLALRFNITNVPSIVLIEKETTAWMLVAGGIIDFSELSNRIYKTIRYLKGESDETAFDNSNYTVLNGVPGKGKLAE